MWRLQTRVHRAVTPLQPAEGNQLLPIFQRLWIRFCPELGINTAVCMQWVFSLVKHPKGSVRKFQTQKPRWELAWLPGPDPKQPERVFNFSHVLTPNSLTEPSWTAPGKCQALHQPPPDQGLGLQVQWEEAVTAPQLWGGVSSGCWVFYSALVCI